MIGSIHFIPEPYMVTMLVGDFLTVSLNRVSGLNESEWAECQRIGSFTGFSQTGTQKPDEPFFLEAPHSSIKNSVLSSKSCRLLYHFFSISSSYLNTTPAAFRIFHHSGEIRNHGHSSTSSTSPRANPSPNHRCLSDSTPGFALIRSQATNQR